MEKKTLVPLIVFLLGICLVSFIVYKTDTHEREQRHITAQLNAATYGERIKNEITDELKLRMRWDRFYQRKWRDSSV